jgi:Uma2 family endonuclease
MATANPPAPAQASPGEPAGSTLAPSIPHNGELYEVIEGKIVELPPMGVYESELAFLLAVALEEFVKARKLGKVVVELLFRIDVPRNLKRRPDLAFVSAKKWPVGKRVPKGEAWDMVPDLAIEIISESNTANEIALKLADYFRAGLGQVWVIYPEVKLVYVYTSPTSVQILAEPAQLDGGDLLPGFRLPLTQLFEDAPEAEPSESAS